MITFTGNQNRDFRFFRISILAFVRHLGHSAPSGLRSSFEARPTLNDQEEVSRSIKVSSEIGNRSRKKAFLILRFLDVADGRFRIFPV